ncbi:MAG: rod shape-determining protein MreD [Oscillospiraceae bacterium]|nr:rod shape-determining protein MreD [Oscillospiraceae bacterium]
MMQARMAIARWIGFSVLLLLAVILQIMVFPRIYALPNPLVSVAAVGSLAVFTGVRGGAAAGFVCGLLCDALLPGVEAYFTFTMMAAGALTGLLCGKVLQRSFWPALALCAASVTLIEFFYILFFQIAARGVPFSAVISVGLPEVLASVCCLPLAYPAFRGVSRVFAEE